VPPSAATPALLLLTCVRVHITIRSFIHMCDMPYSICVYAYIYISSHCLSVSLSLSLIIFYEYEYEYTHRCVSPSAATPAPLLPICVRGCSFMCVTCLIIYMHIYILLCTARLIHMCDLTDSNVCVCVCAYVCVCVCMCLLMCVYVYMYVCTCVHVWKMPSPHVRHD